MNSSEIEVFLTIIRHGNISNASKHLYISQSTISQKIKSLEEKLGVTLFIRSKGISNVELTQEGKHFHKIAMRWEDLLEESQMIKEKHFNQKLSIAAVDSIHNYVMSEIYRTLVLDNKEINYFFRTHQSPEIHSLVESNIVDIGFLLEERYSKSLIKEKYFKEDMVLLMNKNINPDLINNLQQLDLTKEIFIDWGTNYRVWRAKNIGIETTLGVQVDTGLLLKDFFEEEKTWSIIPISLAKNIIKDYDAYLIAFQNNVPFRTCFLVYSKYNNKVIQTVEKLKGKRNTINKNLEIKSDLITKVIQAD